VPARRTDKHQVRGDLPLPRQILPDVEAAELCRRITAQTIYRRKPAAIFSGRRSFTFCDKRAFPVNFGITVFLGFTVGTAIAGQAFYLSICLPSRTAGSPANGPSRSDGNRLRRGCVVKIPGTKSSLHVSLAGYCAQPETKKLPQGQ
jgi:hypothetical protein